MTNTNFIRLHVLGVHCFVSFVNKQKPRMSATQESSPIVSVRNTRATMFKHYTCSKRLPGMSAPSVKQKACSKCFPAMQSQLCKISCAQLRYAQVSHAAAKLK